MKLSLHIVWVAIAGFLGLIGSQAVCAEEAKSWTEKVKLNGDFRYRHESIFKENAKDRNRHRIRLRAGLKADINEKTLLVLRLASGRGEAVSTNQDLGDDSGEKPVWIDRAYMEYSWCKSLGFIGGKQPIPFVASDLVWDPDLNLEGIAARYGSKETSFYGSAGGYWLTESSGARDQGLFSAQIGRAFAGEKSKLDVAIAYHDFQNIKDGPIVGSQGGNSVVNERYVSDYNLFQIRLDYERKLADKQLNIWGEAVRNTSAAAPHSDDFPDRNNGYVLGLMMKAPKAFRPWDIGYNVRVLERNAALAAFTDSDFIGGGTNGWGHRVTAGISPEKNLTMRSTYFLNYIDPYDNGRNLTYQRLMLDAEVKF